MQTIEQFRDLFAYDRWANGKFIEALRRDNCARGRQIFAHIVTTQEEWFERFDGKDSTGHDFWPDLSIDESEAHSEAIGAKFAGFLAQQGEADLDRRTQYKNSSGEPFENAIRDILTHVIIHSAIHRGNIVIKLRESGFEPPDTDYIIYFRETRGS
jgi:uncharacterized damage-inducible protein DinB